MPDTLEELLALEREIEREWWWLNGALHAIAQVRSGDVRGFREMQAQKFAVDQKRVEIATRIASLVGPAKAD
jgi:hypothetical protein